MDERELITYLRTRFSKPPHLENWMDDDCEIINLGDRTLLVSVDTSSEKADFPTETPPEEIGYFSTALSLSDIAACGGDPLGVLVSCSIPPHFANKITAIYEGIGQAVADAGTFLLGGDTNSAGELSLSVVSLGLTKPESVLRRHTGKDGDLVGVTGVLDRFNFLYQQYTEGLLTEFPSGFRQPAPIRAGKLLSSLQGVTSCIDLPDGLIKTLNDNTPPRLGFLIQDRDIPVQNLPKIKTQPNYISASLPAGDIELLFTASPSERNRIGEAFQNARIPLYWIGKVATRPGIQIEMAGGELITPTIQGFIHKLNGYKLFEQKSQR